MDPAAAQAMDTRQQTDTAGGVPAEAGGLAGTLIANRGPLLRFLRARGAGDAAEDLLQELWLKVGASPPRGPVGAPLPYLYRAADTLMIDRYRAETAARRRERAWAETGGPAVPGRSEEPAGERVLIAREQARAVSGVLAGLGERAARVFRRHRVDGVAQRDVALDEGVSLSTVESDLRRAGRALTALREGWDD